MKIKAYLDYFNKGAKKKVNNTIHYAKNIRRYKKSFSFNNS